MKIDWNTWKKSFPYKCSECGYIHNTMREYCEGCGKKGTMTETKKDDFRNAKNN